MSRVEHGAKRRAGAGQGVVDRRGDLAAGDADPDRGVPGRLRQKVGPDVVREEVDARRRPRRGRRGSRAIPSSRCRR